MKALLKIFMMSQPLHNTSAIVEGVSTNLYAYDVLTQALAVETQNGVEISRAYDALGRNIGFSLGSDYAVEYGYDTYGRFASVASSIASTASTPSTQSMYTYSYLPNTDLLAGYTAGDFTRTVSCTHRPPHQLTLG